MNCQKAFSITVSSGACSTLPTEQSSTSQSGIGAAAADEAGNTLLVNNNGDLAQRQLFLYALPGMGLITSHNKGVNFNLAPSGTNVAWNEAQQKYISLALSDADGEHIFVTTPAGVTTDVVWGVAGADSRVTCAGNLAFCNAQVYVAKFNCVTNAVDATGDFTNSGAFDWTVADIAYADNVAALYALVMDSTNRKAVLKWTDASLNIVGSLDLPEIVPGSTPDVGSLIYSTDSGKLYAFYSGFTTATVYFVVIIDPMTNTVVDSLTFSTTSGSCSPGNAVYNATTHQAYFGFSDNTDQRICVVCCDTDTLVGTPVVDSTGSYRVFFSNPDPANTGVILVTGTDSGSPFTMNIKSFKVV